MPAAGEQVWYWFRELDTQRQSNGFGMNALGFREIRAWRLERGLDVLLTWQLDAILALDLTRRAVEAKKAGEPGKEPDKISEQPLTPKSMAYLFPGKRKRFSRDGRLLN